MLPILLGLIIIDVATRRIAWDWLSTKKMLAGAMGYVQSHTATRKVESGATLDALRRVRGEVADTKFNTPQEAGSTGTAPAPKPDRSAKFEAKGVEGNITDVVGGASDKPIPSAPKKPEPKGAPQTPASTTNSLLEAKRRARQQMQDKEKGEQ